MEIFEHLSPFRQLVRTYRDLKGLQIVCRALFCVKGGKLRAVSYTYSESILGVSLEYGESGR